ncbi:MAG: SUMF1/EgtB/PvdO family nonheme iron enzyme [Sorangiineae bacterium]|nr:SUMF1/EgtB/PvdO family nonheme iron enzyme [Sorangiineae bacterium]
MRAVRAAAYAVVSISLLTACGRATGSSAAPAPAAEPTVTLAAAPAAALVNVASTALVEEAPAAPSACPDGMLLVEGDYCPNVQLNCRRYLDAPGGRFSEFRCAEYAPSTCRSKERVHKRFCIDQYEYRASGSTLPENHQSWTMADKTCRGLGKRTCWESEYNFACEGEELRPYPYGFDRDATACNADHTDVVDATGKLKDMRAAPGEYPRCASPFGVMDLAGNLEEFVSIDGSTPVRPAMKGAYWQPSRNFCRAAQTAHDRYYNGTETGFRCCSDPADARAD